jgi:hypothetical protein
MCCGERKSDRPMDRHLFDRWLYTAEKKAKLVRREARRAPRCVRCGCRAGSPVYGNQPRQRPRRSR